MVDAENYIANRNSWICRIVMFIVWPLVAWQVFGSLITSFGVMMLLTGTIWGIVYGVADFSGATTSVGTIITLFVKRKFIELCFPHSHSHVSVVLSFLPFCRACGVGVAALGTFTQPKEKSY